MRVSDGSECFRHNFQDGSEALSKNLRRKVRILSAAGEVRLQVHSLEDDLIQALPQFMSMHVRQWFGRPDCGLTFTRPDMLFFYRECIRALSGAGLLGLIELTVGGRPAAFDFGFLHDRTFWSWRPSYELALAQGSPGALLQALAFNQLSESGFLAYDFMRGAYPYKELIADQRFRNAVFQIVPAPASV
jgi:CelD/BcsL family acetyltransferase involved in cellulose biosynthesis